MPEPDTEPENYSIDEMMERLRSRSGDTRDGEPELVTRDDGTQAYKVRKRKRRSHQPKKEKEKRQRRFKVAQVVGAVVLVGAAGLSLLGGVIYLNTDGYRKNLLSKVETWTGAKADVANLSVTPITIGAGSFKLQWPEGSMLKSLSANQVSGKLGLSSFFGTWKGEELVASGGAQLLLGAPAAERPAEPQRSGNLPFQFRYRAKQLAVVAGDPARPAFRVDQSEGQLTVLDEQASVCNLLLQGGTLTLQGWEPLTLDFASIQGVPGGLRLGTLRLIAPSAAKSSIVIDNPENHITGFDGKPLTYGMELSHVPIGSLIGPGLGKLFTAEIDSVTDDKVEPASITLAVLSDQPVSFQAPFRARPTISPTLTGLAFLDRLKDDLKSALYTKPAFDLQAEGVVRRDAAGIRLEQLELRTRGYIALKGSITVGPAGELGGVLDIGIPEGSIHEAGAAYVRTFRRNEAGIAWATVKLSGTIDKPADDFATQLQRGPTGAASSSGLEKEWEDLTR